MTFKRRRRDIIQRIKDEQEIKKCRKMTQNELWAYLQLKYIET